MGSTVKSVGDPITAQSYNDLRADVGVDGAGTGHGHAGAADGKKIVVGALDPAGSAAGQLPTSTGPATAPTWQTPSSVALGTAIPLVESGTGAAGAATAGSREDHVHPLAQAFATPAIGLGAAAAAGVAATVIRSDATIAAFDATAPAAQVLGDAAAVGAAAFAARRDHRHGLSATAQEASLGADVAMATAGTFYDGPSTSLAAGTWLVVATVTVGVTHDAAALSLRGIVARLWIGTTVEASSEMRIPANNATNGIGSITLVGVVSPTAATTCKVSVATTLSGTILAATPDYGSGNHASRIVAVKIA